MSEKALIEESIEEYLNEMGKSIVPNHSAFKNPLFPKEAVIDICYKLLKKYKQEQGVKG